MGVAAAGHRPTPRVAGRVALAMTILCAMLWPAVGGARADGAPCEPLLVTLSPEGTTGLATAVAITAQAVDRGTGGWVTVTWQADTATQLTAVTLTDLDGSTSTRTGDLTTGSAFDVVELRFCGTTTPGSEPAEPEAAPTVETDPEPSATPETAPAPETAPEPSAPPEPETAPAPEAVPEPDPEAVPDHSGNDAPEDTPSPAPDTDTSAPRSRTDDGTRDAERPDEVQPEAQAGAETDDADAEVLGIQLDNDGDAGGGRTVLIGLAIMLGLGAFTATAALWVRREAV